jgi:hypothetical protein
VAHVLFDTGTIGLMVAHDLSGSLSTGGYSDGIIDSKHDYTTVQ